jgi:hypothetical protein
MIAGRFVASMRREKRDSVTRDRAVARHARALVTPLNVEYPSPALPAGPRRLALALVANAEIRLVNGDVFTVDGTLDEVEKELSDAARSAQSRLAWFNEHGANGSVGINPAHVAALRVSENSD